VSDSYFVSFFSFDFKKSSIFLRFWKGRGFGKLMSEPVVEQFTETSAFSESPLFFSFAAAERRNLFNSWKVRESKKSPFFVFASGFLFQRNSAVSSPTYQRLMEELCASDVQLVSSYLNQVTVLFVV
jgi:hypothetical protein